MRPLGRSLALLAGLWVAAAPASLAAQTLVPAGEALRGGAVGLVHVEARPGSAVVAATLALPVGSAADPQGREGAARATAGVVARGIEAALGPGAGPARVEVTAYRTLITVLAPAEGWQVLLDAIVAEAFRAAPDPAAVAAELGALEEVLVFEAGTPVTDVLVQSARLLLGAADAGARPPGGTLEGVRALDAQAIDQFRRAHYDAASAALAVVGVDDGPAAARHLGVTPPTAPTPAATPATTDSAAAPPVDSTGAPAAAPAPTPAGYRGAPPWTTGDRVRIVQEVTNTWIMAAYPAPDDLPRTLIEFAAHRLHEELNPTPPDPGLFSARVQLRDLPSGRALVIEAAVLPDAAESWEARIGRAVERLAEIPDPSFFLWQRRRFRSAVLLAESAPETASERHAVDLLTLGGVRDLREALWRIDAEGLGEAVTSLGPPRILVYGPDLAAGPPNP